MRVLVCGGRDFMDRDWLFRELDCLRSARGVTIIISGCARGADTSASNGRRPEELRSRGFLSDWNTRGRAAGPIRNQQMLDEGKPDLVVAFPGGRGTADMVRRTRAAGVELILL